MDDKHKSMLQAALGVWAGWQLEDCWLVEVPEISLTVPVWCTVPFANVTLLPVLVSEQVALDCRMLQGKKLVGYKWIGGAVLPSVCEFTGMLSGCTWDWTGHYLRWEKAEPFSLPLCVGKRYRVRIEEVRGGGPTCLCGCGVPTLYEDEDGGFYVQCVKCGACTGRKSCKVEAWAAWDAMQGNKC